MDTRTLLTTDIKTRKLISVNRDIMEKALKNQYWEKVLARRRNAMGDILLQTEAVASS